MALADPDQLEQLADKLDKKAALVREHNADFRRRVSQVAWQSDGAASYRKKCTDLRSDLEGNAVELEDAAASLRTHAARVRERIEWMQDMVDKLKDEAKEAWDDTQGAFDWSKDKADDAWDKVKGLW